MTANPIAGRIFQFLKKYPPYDRIADEDLEKLCHTSALTHYTDGEIIFEAGAATNPYVYVVYKGQVQLKWPGSQVIFDSAEPGDTFGIRAAFSGNPYVLTAVTAVESLVITLDLIFFRQLLYSQASFSAFFASGMASGTIPQHQQWDHIEQHRLDSTDASVTVEDILGQFHEPITCSEDSSISDIARMMIEHQVGSVVITNRLKYPIGIVTDKDIRRMVAQKADILRLRSGDIMSSPVRTISPQNLWADAYIAMAEHGIRHLVVTTDGSDTAPVLGVVSEHDLLRRNSMQMLSTLNKITSAPDLSTLSRWRDDAENRIKKFVQNELPIEKIASLANRVNDLTTQRAIALSISDVRSKFDLQGTDSWCWLALGSYGRKEQIIRTDQDNALIFKGSEVFRTFYLALAERITTYLEQCGYEKCPAEVMASNPKWCLTLDEWKAMFSRWIRQPDPKAVMHTTIFFDLRPVYGDDTLAGVLKKHIAEEVSRDKKFLSYLAANALSSPPAFTFFKSLAVEDSGTHKGLFDLKARALAPYADIARLMAIYHRYWVSASTIERFMAVAELEPHYTDLLRDAAKAYQWLTKIRTKNAISHNSGGRWISKSFLSPLERQILKKALMPLQELNDIVQTRFQTHLLSV